MAAAFFAGATPPRWEATTAGIHPGEAVSPNAVRLLEGSAEETLLDRSAPSALGEASRAARAALVVPIDCDALQDEAMGEKPDAASGTRHERWDLEARTMDEAMRDELRARALALAEQLRTGGGADR